MTTTNDHERATERILELRRERMTFPQIAQQLSAAGVPCPTATPWRAVDVSRLLADLPGRERPYRERERQQPMAERRARMNQPEFRKRARISGGVQ